MPGKKSRIPQLCRHKATKQGYVTLNGKPQYLGVWPDIVETAPKAVQQRYDVAIAKWLASGRTTVRIFAEQIGDGITVGELILAFWPHVEQYYRHPDGAPTSEVDEFRNSLKPLRRLYADLPAASFLSLELKAVQATMIQSGWCRGVINQRVGRIKRMFKWAVSEKLIVGTVMYELQSVRGLKAGRTEARETEPVVAVPESVVDATIPHLAPTVRAMVELQRLTGMRPAEVCMIRAVDMDMTGAVWIYKPPRHKTAWQGKKRAICMGPKAQSIIRGLLKPDTQKPIFSPRDAASRHSADRRANRKTPLWPSHIEAQTNKRKRCPKRAPKDRYTTVTYRKAIFRACDRAFPLPESLAQQKGETNAKWLVRLTKEQHSEMKQWRKSHRWHPNQLRHLHGTQIRKRFGLEAAQVALGHSRADVTQIYAARDLSLAEKVAAEIG
jgi:integrase